MEQTQRSRFNITDLEEPAGNFIRIFPELGLTRDEIKLKIELTGEIKSVKPLEYFEKVGNGMNPKSQVLEISKIIPDETLDPKQRARIALVYLDKGNHIGVSPEQFENDLKRGKNHDDTMRYFLERVLSDAQLEPCVVAVTKRAETKFGQGINKIILDGTHRAVIAAVLNIDLEVLEFQIK